MKWMMAIVIAVVSSRSLVLACAKASATQPAEAAFEKLKTLVGQWKGKDSDGQEWANSFELVANDSAIMEKMHMNMVTMYTLDSGRVLLTHYCAAQNQPRMAAAKLENDGSTLHFSFLDASGMVDAKEGHMHDVKFTFVDADHIKEQWTFRQDGVDQKSQAVLLERVKPKE